MHIKSEIGVNERTGDVRVAVYFLDDSFAVPEKLK